MTLTKEQISQRYAEVSARLEEARAVWMTAVDAAYADLKEMEPDLAPIVMQLFKYERNAARFLAGAPVGYAPKAANWYEFLAAGGRLKLEQEIGATLYGVYT